MTLLDGFAPLQFLSLVEQFNAFTFATAGNYCTRARQGARTHGPARYF